MPLSLAPPLRLAPSQALKFKYLFSSNESILLKLKSRYRALQRATEQRTKTHPEPFTVQKIAQTLRGSERSEHKKRAAHTGRPSTNLYFMPAAFKIIRTGARMNNNIFTPPYIMPFSLNSRTSPKRLAMVSSLSTMAKYSEQKRPPAAVLL